MYSHSGQSLAFVNAGAGNFHLTATSPAINAGVSLGAPYNVDKDGAPRVTPPDAGAYEFGSIASLPSGEIRFGEPPSNTPVGVAMVPAPTVYVLDTAGAFKADATDAITISLWQNPAGGTLSCGPATCTRAAVEGVATFSGLIVDTVGGSYTFRALTTGMADPQDQSDFFDITPATLPNAPTALTILSDTVASNGQLQLGWSYTQGSTLATGFVIERQEGCVGSFVARPGMPVALTPLTYTDTGLGTTASYCWQVKAQSAGEVLSATSNFVQRTGTVVPAPTNLSINLYSTGNFLAR